MITTTRISTGTLAADLAEHTPPVPEGFSVRDEQTANWVIRKIIEARQYDRHVQDGAVRDTRRDHADEKFFLHRYGQQVEDWARRQLEHESGRRKSLNLPAGTVGFRNEPQRLDVADDDALLRWCRANLPSAIAV